jgi:tetratricopeptide (TPR) repeat protein
LRYFIIFLISISGFSSSHAQTKKHITNPKAKLLNDQAIRLFTSGGQSPDTVAKVNRLLDEAVKLDSNYYEGWINKLSFQCHYDHYTEGLKTLKRMSRIFPGIDEVTMFYGVLQYKTGNKTEALAAFGKLLKKYNGLLEKNKNNANTKGLLFNKGVILIMTDKTAEGQALLRKLYEEEKDPMTKSNIAFYVNSTRDQIIEDKIPGK